MWFAASGGGGRGTAVTGFISNTLVRHFSRKRGENLRKINPRVTPQEASSIANDLFGVIKKHGPLSISNTWVQAKESGVGGLSSKTHLKLMLKWMRGRKMLQLLCDHVGSSKKFLISTPLDEAQIEERKSSLVTRMVTKSKKPRIKGKKKSK
ncbi:Tumor necrosis factor receptor family protein [Quillaja saponaria]|uniref:Tumor necrosis factor receptor family protein n=1 Tax=Quillaja saponaria TaxID=32244 RepID=A0AAD7QIR1_QUISA|nr:Tumor necrosis factor receptor family protein [Quillaja saponaria]